MPGSNIAAKLYGIVDLGYVDPLKVEQVATQLVIGGAGIIQLRAKGHKREKIYDWALRVRAVCRAAEVPFIVNDDPVMAQAVDADGVHLGQDDGSLEAARRVVGDQAIVGRSTHSPEQARAALAEGFDYIGFGPLFPTPTKLGRPGIGLEGIEAVQREVGSEIPVFCIGGIHRGNLNEVCDAGARRVVIVSDLLKSPEISVAVGEAVALLERAADASGRVI